jgi:hypothetical protein
MVSRGYIRLILAPIGGLVCLLAFTAASVTAQEPVSCTVKVDPLAASGGSVFVFSGTGYEPDHVILQKRGAEPIQHDIDVGDADPWRLRVRSRVGDEGTWSATFTDPITNCIAMIDFRVTLSSTDAVSEPTGTTGTAPAPVLLYLLVVVGGFSGGVLIGRRVQAGHRGIQPNGH